LVAGQVALTSVLLIGAGLLGRSFQTLQSVPLGFNTDHVLVADIDLGDTKYANQANCNVFFNTLLDKLQQLPGVIAASLNDNLPFFRSDVEVFGAVGQPDPEQVDKMPLLDFQVVSPNYFRTIGIRLLQGRFFNDHDQADTQSVVIISESIAQHFFPGQDPIGKEIHDFEDLAGRKRNFYTVIGVAANVQHSNPESQQTPFQAYYLYTQDPYVGGSVNFGTLLIHTKVEPNSMIPAVRNVVSTLDPNLPLSNAHSFDELVMQSFATRRLAALVVSLFSGVALLLAAVGLYAILSYAVTQRSREISIRMAVGAKSTNILGLVIRRGLAIVGIGLVIGVATALMLARFIQSNLYGVSAYDPVTLAMGVLVLSLTGFFACFLPAVRATRINPIKALRE
jgi:putative ABC transport system permease protein